MKVIEVDGTVLECTVKEYLEYQSGTEQIIKSIPTLTSDELQAKIDILSSKEFLEEQVRRISRKSSTQSLVRATVEKHQRLSQKSPEVFSITRGPYKTRKKLDTQLARDKFISKRAQEYILTGNSRRLAHEKAVADYDSIGYEKKHYSKKPLCTQRT